MQAKENNLLPLDIVPVIADYVGSYQLSLTCKRLWECLAFRFLPRVASRREWQSFLIHWKDSESLVLRNVRCMSFCWERHEDTPQAYSNAFTQYNLVHLHKLRLSFCASSNECQALGNSLYQLKYLRSLQVTLSPLAASDWANNTWWWVGGLQNKQELHTLDIEVDALDYQYPVGYAGDNAASSLGEVLAKYQFPQLQRLTITFGAFQIDSGAHSLMAGLSHVLPLLSDFTLNLSGNRGVDDESLQLLSSALSVATQLHTARFCLWTTAIGSVGVIALCNSLQILPQLATVFLYLYDNNKIGDDTVNSFLSLCRNGTKLKKLIVDVDNTSITDTVALNVAFRKLPGASLFT
eukprot:TRINITY_DN46480_c0_g1_i1.p1 TRINITY_DN46480_c0_g1~~TRINITY_DN46480_c0_g1_i1.p1  ORF type:complete len:351 (-),score=3.91 TRINITY_DN46480_c0_g1_i1:65-1117(-)